MLVDAVRHEELRVLRPSVAALGETDLLVAERLAVGLRRVLLVRRTVADVAVEDDERGAALRLPEHLERVLDAIDVVGVADAQDVPAVGEEPGGDVLGEGDAGVAFDGDVVVVVDPAEIVEAEVAGEGRRLRRDALHQAAVAADGVDVVVEDLEARPVVAVGEPLLGDGHADAGGDALAERAGRRLDAGDPVVLGMPGRLAVELAEPADVVERHRRLAEPLVVRVHRLRLREMQHRPEQHRGVAVRQHEPVAVGPDRVLRIEVHDAVPDRVDQRRERHRRAGVAGLGRLHRVDREGADRVDGKLVHRVVASMAVSSSCRVLRGSIAGHCSPTAARSASTSASLLAHPPGGNRSSPCAQAAQHRDLLRAGHQPENAPRTVEDRIGQRHPPPRHVERRSARRRGRGRPAPGSPGTSEAVWPSGPRPRCTRSSTGGVPAICSRSRA